VTAAGKSPRPFEPLRLSLRAGVLGAGGVGVLAVGLGALGGGARGAGSAAAGLLLVVLFFVVSLYLVEVANRVAAAFTLPAAMAIYGTLITWLGVLAFSTSLPDKLNKPAFAWTVIAGCLGWVVAQSTAVWRGRLSYVDVPLPTRSSEALDDAPPDAVGRGDGTPP
jgi:ATP synthase protein I